MPTFILRDGRRIVTARFVQGPGLSPGMVWRQDTDHGPYREVPSPHGACSDPNATLMLFGEPADIFMRRQYK